MQHESTVLAESEGLGSVRRCAHGCVHIQVGFLSMTLSDQQYMQMVAMLTDSAAHFANLEFFRASSEIDEAQ